MMTLSEIWERAARELKQGGGKMFDPEDGTHCALGAVVHYRYGHEKCLGNFGFGILEDQHDVIAFGKKFRAERKGEDALERIYSRNDNDQKRWSFRHFAAKAREIEDKKTKPLDSNQIRLTAFVSRELPIEILVSS